MEITSRYIEDSVVGNLHVVTFSPENAVPDERATVFNSFNGRVSTIDGFAVPYVYAETTGLITDYVERPGTGTSSSIFDNRLRKEQRKHGYIAISDAVAEALGTDPAHARAKRLHAAGFSLGWHAASMYLESVGERAASTAAIDGAGTCSVNHTIGSARFFGYFGIEAAAKATGKFPDKDAAFVSQKDIFDQFMKDTGLPEPPPLNKIEKITELHEVTQPTQGEALRTISRVMHRAANAGRDFEMRALVTPMRFVTDHRTIREVNEMLDRFDAKFPEQETVRYGLFQKNGLQWWHDLCTDPAIVRKFLTTPISGLRRRLRYFR